MLTDKSKKLALALFDIGAIKFGRFKLKLHEKKPDAPLSPIYIDLRILRSFPNALRLAVDMFRELTKDLNFEIYAEVPTAITPIVAVLSYITELPMISPRRAEKTHGISGKINGIFKEGQVVLLIDDLITQADSKLEAIYILQEKGLIVKDVVVLVDREQGGSEKLKKEGYGFRTAFKLSELLEFYLKTERINQKKYNETISYLKATTD